MPLQQNVVDCDAANYISMSYSVVFNWLISQSKEICLKLIYRSGRHLTLSEGVLYGLIFVRHDVTPNVPVQARRRVSDDVAWNRGLATIISRMMVTLLADTRS